MAKPPTPLAFRAEDLPVSATVLQNLNTFLRQVKTALTNALTLTANNNAAVVTQTFIAGAASITFKHGLVGRCTDLWCTQASAGDGSAVPPFALNWHDDGAGSVVMGSPNGLTASVTYTMRFMCLGEGA